MFEDTMRILKQGYYVKNDKRIDLKLSYEEMLKAQVYLPEEVCEKAYHLKYPERENTCEFTCENIDSYAQAMKREDVLVLNFANPVHPGGGVRKGASAQEEDLCRKSSLLLSLESKHAHGYYAYHRGLRTYMGSDAVIISPKVEIIRDSRGNLLDETVIVSVITCAAPMISHGIEGLSDEEYREMFEGRISNMLKLAGSLGYRNIVLGAWGCGAFGNDAHIVSGLFYKALKEIDYDRLFDHVDFAVLDRSYDKYNFNEFKNCFMDFHRDDKIRGCLIAGAAGDALGYAIEFYSEDDIERKYGPQGIAKYELSPRNGNALFSDDTQMTLFTANGMLVYATKRTLMGSHTKPRHYVAQAYQDWLVTQDGFYDGHTSSQSWLLDVKGLYSRRAPGNTCLSSLYYLRKNSEGIEDYTKDHWNLSKGCGGVMRVAPVGLVPHEDIEKVDIEAAQIAAITHGHPLGYLPAAMLAHIVHRCVFSRGEDTLKDIVIDARDTVARVFQNTPYMEDLTEIISLAMRLSENDKNDLENIHTLGEGWVGEEALAIAVYCALRYTNDFTKALLASVNHKGDSDSTGAITGNILGAWIGYKAIPEQWKEHLDLHDVIMEIADDLSNIDKEYDREWERKYMEGKRK